MDAKTSLIAWARDRLRGRRVRYGLTALAVVVVVAGLVAVLRADGGKKEAAPILPSTTSTTEPLPPCATGGGGAPPTTVSQGAVGNDPFTGRGARQLAGPSTTVTTIPTQPVSYVADVPPNPDEHVAARTIEGVVTGPVPLPHPGSLSATSPGTPTASSVSTSAPQPEAASCIDPEWP